MNERLIDAHQYEPRKSLSPDGEIIDGYIPHDDVDRLMNEMNISAVEARELLGVENVFDTDETAEAILNDTVVEGASVRLVDRAEALETVMAAFNKEGSIKAIKEMRAANPHDNRFDKKYDRPDIILAGMNSDLKGKYALAATAFGVLAGRDGLLSQGTPAEEVNAVEMGIKNDIQLGFGQGRMYAKQRAKAIAPALKVAKKTSRYL